MKRFKIIASIVGPYFPKTELSLGKFLIKFSKTTVASNIPPKPTVGTKDESLVSLNQEILFHSKYYVIWDQEANSSKIAYELGKNDLNYLLSCLELPASSYKYFAKIIRVEHVIDSNAPDPESPSSDPIHVLSYKPGDLLAETTKFYEAILLTDNQEVKELITKFYEGIKGEILSQGDSNLKYFKLLEEISIKTLKKLKQSNSRNKPNYKEVLDKIKTLINSTSEDIVKVKEMKKFANKLRALDYEQIGERIILTAKEFRLTDEVIKTIQNINKYRAKVLAHSGNEDAIKLEDSRDIREISRLFLLHYLSKFYSILPPDFNPVKENDSWYQYNYSRSDSK